MLRSGCPKLYSAKYFMENTNKYFWNNKKPKCIDEILQQVCL